MITRHFWRMAEQLVDSEVESTRVYWRRLMGFPEKIVNDPRRLEEIK